MSTEPASPDGVVVSVIVPCRNASRWIRETLESVSTQSGVALETIVVDDGSTDETTRAVRASGAAVRLIHQAPLGVSHARNVGMSAATGRYLQFLDADDVLMAGTLADRVDALERSGHDVAYTAWIRWEQRPDGAFVDAALVDRGLGDRPDVDVLTDAWWPPGALLYRRSIVDRIGPMRDDLPVIQDARFLLDAALRDARFVRVGGPGLKYRVHGPDSLSRRDPAAFLDDCYRSAAELHDRWRQERTLDLPRRDGLVKVFAYLARQTFPTDRQRFEQILERLLQLDPAFRPAAPATLRAVSRLVGYRASEHVALWWRRLKRIGPHP